MSNVISPFKPRSFCDVTWRGRQMAMAGATAAEICDATGMHMMACARLVAEFQAHEAKWNKVLQK